MLDISEKDFEMLVKEGIDAIPEKFVQMLKNVAIVVSDDPTKAQRKRMELDQNTTLFGLYEGIPQIARGDYYSFVSPDKITIFRLPILRVSHTLEEAREIVKNTVWHEVAHHLGMTESEVMKREKEEGRDAY